MILRDLIFQIFYVLMVLFHELFVLFFNFRVLRVQSLSFHLLVSLKDDYGIHLIIVFALPDVWFRFFRIKLLLNWVIFP